jgi:MFS family permease
LAEPGAATLAATPAMTEPQTADVLAALETPRAALIPLALAQFVCSYAASNMNVAVSSIAHDLGTDVSGVQVAITIFTLTMAALMIPGSKLTDIFGRKRCFMAGLVIYGIGALIAALAPGILVLMIGYSFLQGIGTALLIPPVYILATVLVSDPTRRAKVFGTISAAGGIGAAAGPLIGGLITTTTSWRVSFIAQTLLVLGIIALGRQIVDVASRDRKPSFDFSGAFYSAGGLVLIVVGILQTSAYGWFTTPKDFAIGGTVIIPAGGISPVWVFAAIGFALIGLFFRHIRRVERAGGDPLLSTRMFQNRVANLGLVTQNIQWLVLLGLSFTVSVFLQTVQGYNAIQTGLILTPATVGILVSSMSAARLAKRRPQAFLVRRGFAVTIVGLLVMLVLGGEHAAALAFAPGLFLVGIGVGAMLTSSVNVVQSAFPEQDQGEISGLSRSVSNLGSSIGVAIAGSIIVSPLFSAGGAYQTAFIVLTGFAIIGLIAAYLMGLQPATSEARRTASRLSRPGA